MENVDHTTDPIDNAAPPAEPENRNRNLDILTAYIRRQRALLERIKEDVDRIQASKPVLVADPSSAIGQVLHIDNNDILRKGEGSQHTIIRGVTKLSELVSEVHGSSEATITKDIDWDALRGSDLAPLHSLQSCAKPSLIPSGAKMNMAPPLTPSTPSLVSARSSLSSFVSLDCSFKKSRKLDESVYQVHVREERLKTVDPALTIAAQFLATLPPDSDDEGLKIARAKEAREAKEARAREAKEARKAKLQNGKPSTNSATKGHIRKSAHRRKSEASAAAAATRPRGQGGRFRKKEQASNETLALDTQNACTSVPPLSASESAIDLTSRAQQPRFTSSTPSLLGLEEDRHRGKSQRARKPSVRFGSAAPSVSSTRSSRSQSSIPARAAGKGREDVQLSSVSSVMPSNHPRGRLTIRIPARPPVKYPTRNDLEDTSLQVSASTSMASTTPGQSGDTGPVSDVNGAGRFGGKYRGIRELGGVESAIDNEQHPVSPSTTSSHSRLFYVKQEEETRENGMDLDDMFDWDAFAGRNGRSKHDAEYKSSQTMYEVKRESSPQADEMSLSDADSDASFVCELLPPVPGSSASSSSAGRAGLSRSANESINGKLDTSRSSSRRGNPSSKTFNMTWSDEEQRLLDMLLERYPDGTRNRWANISRAMGGSRTPRQVASRVQKYFAKMKKWGIDVA